MDRGAGLCVGDVDEVFDLCASLCLTTTGCSDGLCCVRLSAGDVFLVSLMSESPCLEAGFHKCRFWPRSDALLKSRITAARNLICQVQEDEGTELMKTHPGDRVNVKCAGGKRLYM